MFTFRSLNEFDADVGTVQLIDGILSPLGEDVLTRSLPSLQEHGTQRCGPCASGNRRPQRSAQLAPMEKDGGIPLVGHVHCLLRVGNSRRGIRHSCLDARIRPGFDLRR